MPELFNLMSDDEMRMVSVLCKINDMLWVVLLSV